MKWVFLAACLVVCAIPTWRRRRVTRRLNALMSEEWLRRAINREHNEDFRR